MRDLSKTALPITTIVAVVGAACALTWAGAEWKHAIAENTRAVMQLSSDLDGLAKRTDAQLQAIDTRLRKLEERR